LLAHPCQSLLKSDEVQFATIPVFSNSHLQKEIDKVEDSTYVRSLVFINCGGILDMQGQWFYERDNIKAYLMDYHRPYNHANVNDPNNKIFVIEDGCPSFKECPTAEDDRIYQELCQFEDDESSSDYDSENQSDD
jgi:hypothetical protein